MQLSPAIPILRSFFEDKAREFYLGFLGFTLDWEVPLLRPRPPVPAGDAGRSRAAPQ
jgi:hypothetical protein